MANIFTGWVDVDLSEKGLGEAKGAGELLKAEHPTDVIDEGKGGTGYSLGWHIVTQFILFGLEHYIFVLNLNTATHHMWHHQVSTGGLLSWCPHLAAYR